MGARRILFIYPNLTLGGAERQLALLALRIGDYGFEPLVATLRSRGPYFDELRQAGVPTAYLGMRSRVDVRSIVRAYRLWRLRPAIVFTQGTNAQIIGQAIAYRAGATHITVEQAGVGYARGAHRTLLVGLVARTVDRVVCASETQVPDLLRLGYRRSSICVIPNGAPDPLPTSSSSDTRLRLGLRNDDIVVLLVAALRPEKRVDVFLEAVQTAHAQDARVRGIVAGGGPALSGLRTQAQALGGAVRLIGERSDVSALMASADAVCLTSDVEAVPVTLLEAMAAGKPVIATSVGGVPDLVTPSETGWLVPPDDSRSFAEAILVLASDLEHARALGKNGRARYEQEYTVELMVERYAELLTEAGQDSEKG